jgi:hypothetical protein
MSWELVNKTVIFSGLFLYKTVCHICKIAKEVCTAQEQLNIFNPYQNEQEQKEHGSLKTL